ncbi:MAG: Dihydrofolate synthase @ Folylpolyglutamate synthase [uncultured Thermomicrobiales bacterium]|uniref:Dihydrofolate synthase/folylpolyglutamate synthase n=1 Tax=uncultured Thermomicrobiales bacterium TaxID=1645740 RepID=A0A6J4VFW3_9BACT|nr:MAG: Dihydrofolate synthase @ Folylpolyglutamate synthase [uncultured Thermomicrobiales bacterium]
MGGDAVAAVRTEAIPRTVPRSNREDLARYDEAVARLDGLIRPASSSRDLSLAAVRARAEYRLGRLRRFLRHLGDPHAAYPVVHVGGTSGKGSTSVAIASILTAAGYRVGLHTSPYLQSATEKLQINGRLIAADDFADLVDVVLGEASRWSAREYPGEILSYGEVWMALVGRWFADERVDIAVIEVGAGGRFDPSNVVTPAVAVITSVGLDHTATLGPTIAAIAWHKAGIIKPGAAVVTAVTDPVALAPIEAEADRTGVTLRRVIPGRTFEVEATGPRGTRWRETDREGGRNVPRWVPLPGRFQATNAALAIEAVGALAERGFPVSPQAVAAGLGAARLPGRLERMPTRSDPRVFLDGAHNPQKMAALTADLPLLMGLPEGQRPVVVVGALEGKDVPAIVREVATKAAGVVATRPRVVGKTGAAPAAVAAAASDARADIEVVVEAEPRAALVRALAMAAPSAAPVLVTGSLYLVGELRAAWYANDEIVRQRTPWPTPGGVSSPRPEDSTAAPGEAGEP